MTRADARTRALAIGLAALAGYVDATGFLASGGLFVSFMSGNSTRIGVDAGSVRAAGTAGALVAGFVAGAAAGHLLGMVAGRRRRPAILLAVSGALAIAALCGGAGQVTAALICAAGAMGAENGVFEADGEVRIGVTYMTGTLVKLGQRLAGALAGGPPLGWLPHLLLWLGLVAGAAGGAAAYPVYGFASLWPACGGALALAWASAAIDP